MDFFNLLVAPTAPGPSKYESPCQNLLACKLWAHLVPGEPSFWYFYVGGPGVSPEVWTFSGSTLKRLKWFFEAAFEPRDYQNIDLHVAEHHLDRLLYGFVHYESRFCHFTETCGSYPAHDFYNFHNVCKDRVVYPYFMPILILSVVFGSLRHLLVIISPYSMSTVIYSHYINLSIFGPVQKVINLMFH